jgi:hypothetical protein
VERRVATIWFLLLFNVLGTLEAFSILPIPSRVRQVMTAGALVVALLMALRLNRRGRIRPNLVMVLATFLLGVAVIGTVLESTSWGTVYRTFRFGEFTLVLWLLTPWWGRADLLLARCHLNALTLIGGSVVVGLLAAPSHAWEDGRLSGIVWPIPPTQVGEYAAVVTGMAIVLWMAGAIGRGRAAVLAGGGLGTLLLTHTRTALLGLAVGVVMSTVLMFVARRRVRRVVLLTIVVGPILFAATAPTVTSFVARGQTSADIADLSGRRSVWAVLLEERRPGAERWIGHGITNKSFNGKAIDDDWLAVYLDEGLVGDALVAAVFITLLVTAALRPSSTARALAVFLTGYCLVASYTEVGLGDATPYLMHVVVAASLLVPVITGRPLPAARPAEEAAPTTGAGQPEAPTAGAVSASA